MKKIKSLIFAILIITGALILNFYFSFGYGSFGGFLAEHRNLPNSGNLEQLRNNTSKHLTQDHEKLSRLTGLTLFDHTYFDMCVKGEHSWKRNDSYAYICSYRLTYYYGTNREYKTLLLELEKTLKDLQWTTQIRNPEQPTISEAISNYSGEINLVELPVFVKKGSDNNIFDNSRLTINGFDGYGGYWTKSDTEPTPFGFGIGIQQEIFKKDSSKSPKEIFNKITSAGQDAIMFAISQVYFEN